LNHIPVLKAINEDGYDFKDENIFISGTHTHSGPAGYFDFFPFSIHFTRMGFPISLSCWLLPEVSLIGGRPRDKQ